MKNDFTLADRASTLDLQAYLTRAKRLDPVGMVRVRAFGDVLACYVAPIFAGSLMEQGPTVLGLRTSELAEDAEVDIVVPITAMLDRLAALAANEENWKGKYHVVLPDSVRAPWSGIQPPRSGWELVGEISEELLLKLPRMASPKLLTHFQNPLVGQSPLVFEERSGVDPWKAIRLFLPAPPLLPPDSGFLPKTK